MWSCLWQRWDLVQEIQVCPSSYLGWSLCSQKLSVACRQRFLWQACISKNFHMVMSWGHLQKHKGWCQQWDWVQRDSSVWPHWFLLQGAEAQSSEEKDGKRDFCQYWYEISGSYAGKFVLGVNWYFGTMMSCSRCFKRWCEELKCT